MPHLMLRDDQWERLAPHLPGKSSDRGVTARDNRLFIEAILWIARTGSPWRDLPSLLWELEQRVQALQPMVEDRHLAADC